MPGPSSDALRAERDRFAAFAFAAADGLFELGADGRIAYATGGLKAVLGMDADSLHGLALAELFVERDRDLVSALLAPGGCQRRGPYGVTLAASSRSLVIATLQILPGRVHVALGRHPAPLAAAGPEAVDKASGLLTPAAFLDMTTRYAALLGGEGGGEIALLSIGGLDESVLGGPRNLRLLQQKIATTLRLAAGGGDLASRLDDGRYVVVLDARDGREQLVRDVESAISATVPAVAADLSVQARAVPLGTTNLSPRETRQGLQFLLTDLAKSLADTAGDGELDIERAFSARLRQTNRRIADFRRVVQEERFSLVYQPVVQLDKRSLAHYEALTRFEDRQSPAELIKFAEDMGIIADFDLAVCRRALATLAQPAAAAARIAVNLSVRSLQADSFVDQLGRLLRKAGEAATRLSFEITETCEITDLAGADAVIQKLRRNGNPVVLDDFGAGAAAFHYARHLRVDGLKIDGSYVRRMLEDDRDASLVRSICELATFLNIPATAEMIESEEQAKALRALGVVYGQGYLFGKPSERFNGAARAATRRLGEVEVWA